MLRAIASLEPEAVHPGRGPSGGSELLDRQNAYLANVVAYVQAEKPRADMSDEDRSAALKRVAERLKADYPGYPNARFIEIGLPAVWQRHL